ncbi:MAG: alpha/beta hydrolase-fold protein [Alphaproteobacteria bacterium]|nr:alpha/beta hydrolase-fold protein [Alphaproteobacteria bacterium]
MQKHVTSWYSQQLQQEMPIVRYGHYGIALLLIPTAAADYLEYERFQLIDCLKPFIDQGLLTVFSINSINSQSWLNKTMEPAHKAIRHNQFNAYVIEDVVPYIRNHTSFETPIFTCGASFGALHAMNLFLKYPITIQGTIAMSGVYDLTDYTDGFFDEQVYFNSPYHYIPNLSDDWFLSHIRRSHHIHIYTGSGNYEAPHKNWLFSEELSHKNIPHDLQIWGNDIHHDWETWRKMLPNILGNKFFN